MQEWDLPSFLITREALKVNHNIDANYINNKDSKLERIGCL